MGQLSSIPGMQPMRNTSVTSAKIRGMRNPVLYIPRSESDASCITGSDQLFLVRDVNGVFRNVVHDDDRLLFNRRSSSVTLAPRRVERHSAGVRPGMREAA